MAEIPNSRAGWMPGLCALLLAGTLARAQTDPPSARQRQLERFRTLQLETRQYKKDQRLARIRAAREQAEARELPTALGALEARQGPPRIHAGAGARPRQDTGGLFCLTLLVLGALAQDQQLNSTGRIDLYSSQAEAGLGELRRACDLPRGPGLDLAPCAADYGTGLSAQAEDIRAQMLRLFVDPAVLGAGQCRAGDLPEVAKARIDLDQSDTLARYDILINKAAAIQYQLISAGFALQSAGSGLVAGQVATAAAGGGMTGLSGVPAFALGTAGDSLIEAGFGVQTAGTVFGKISSEAITYRSKYLKWAVRQTPAALAHCTGAPASPGLAPSRDIVDESPLATLESAVRKLAAGCALAGQHGLNLMVCGEDSLAEFTARNGTLSELQLGLPCLSPGVLAPGAPRGSQTGCPRGSLADSATRTITSATFAEFLGETTAAAYGSLTAGNAFFAASEGLMIAGGAAVEAGSPVAGGGLVSGGTVLVGLGNGLFADGYDLLRIAAGSGRWVAELTLMFNADSRAEIEARERNGTRSSSSGTAGPDGSTGAMPAPEAAPSGEPEPEPGTRAVVAAAPGPSASAAARGARPFALRDLLGLLLADFRLVD